MICRSCLRRGASTFRPSRSLPLALSRPLSISHTLSTPADAAKPPVATSTSTAQPSSTPNPISLGTNLKPKSKVALPVSICPAGTTMKGINYLKNRDDPVALKEEEYPEWLWRTLDVKKKEEGEGEGNLDEFSKSKKIRRRAAKRQRKLEAARLASGDTSHLTPKIPLTQQSIDLPGNEQNTVEGALEAVGVREELRRKMRAERRGRIKEGNYLKGM